VRDTELYIDPDTGVLRNKLGIKDPVALALTERKLTLIMARVLEEIPIRGDFDREHYCKIHKAYFEDLYEWAGQLRQIDIQKPEDMLEGDSVPYADYEDIPMLLDRITERMRNRPWEDMTIMQKAVALATDMADIWKVHAFREGNTRTTVTFICDFAESKGIHLDRSLFREYADYLRKSLVIMSVNPAYNVFLVNFVRSSMKEGWESRDQQKQCEKGNIQTMRMRDVSRKIHIACSKISYPKESNQLNNEKAISKAYERRYPN